MEQDNRESWLNRVAAGMAPLFTALGTPLPDRVRVAIGFTSAGRNGKAIGECWDNRRSADGHFEIFIRPDLAHAPDAMPAQIAAILAHELVHAAVGIPAGHGKAFKRIALGLGLVGPMRATTPGDAFLAAVAAILAAAGPLPTPGSIPADRPPRRRSRQRGCSNASVRLAATPSGPHANGLRRLARHYARSRGTGRCTMTRSTAMAMVQSRDAPLSIQPVYAYTSITLYR
jgi:hypothetical protein